jgi:hypothetical protein
MSISDGWIPDLKTSVETDLSVAPFEMASTEGGVELARALLPKCASEQDDGCRTIVSGVYPAAMEMKAVSRKHSYSKHSEHFTVPREEKRAPK